MYKVLELISVQNEKCHNQWLDWMKQFDWMTNPSEPQMGLGIPTTFVNDHKMRYVSLDRLRGHEKWQGKAGSGQKHI